MPTYALTCLMIFHLGGVPRGDTYVAGATVAPAPINTYNVTDDSGITCLLFQASINVTIPYTNIIKKANTTVTVNTPSLNNSTYTGSCGTSDQTLQINFDSTWQLSLFFHKDTKTSKFTYHLSKATLLYTFDTNIFPGIDRNLAGANLTVLGNFSTSVLSTSSPNSYSCKSTSLALRSGVKVTLGNLQYQAFVPGDFASFGAKAVCAADKPLRIRSRDIVAFSVGGGLAGLTLIVLVVYFIGRYKQSTSKVV